MITKYHRPKTIQEALDLLADPSERAVPLGGGTYLSQIKDRVFSVVDLQGLGLDQITLAGNVMKIGGAATLQRLYSTPNLPEPLKQAIVKETNFNLRQKSTVAGTINAADGRSPLTTALLALDAVLTWLPGQVEQGLGTFLLSRGTGMPGKLISSMTFPLNTKLQFETVARTPADRPILCLALARWPSGRLRIAVGGFGSSPIIVLDAPEPGGAELAVRDALTCSGDVWASAEYRQGAASALLKRMLASV